MRSLLHGQTISIPFYIWPLAVLAGLVIAAGSLSYAPYGRINILWVWLIWAGLPTLGSLVSVLLTPLASRQPWLFRWGRGTPHWYPTPVQRLHMIWLVQLVWCLVAVGMLIGYLLLLLFSDLEFHSVAGYRFYRARHVVAGAALAVDMACCGPRRKSGCRHPVSTNCSGRG